MSQSQVTIVINSNDSASTINSALDGIKANNPDTSIVALVNFLRKIIGGVLSDAQFVVTKADGAGTVTFNYGVVVTATPTHSHTPSPTLTPTVTHTVTPTPTVTPTHP